MTFYEKEHDLINNAPISPLEWRKIYCEISEADFDTYSPNSHRIDKVAAGINNYCKAVGLLMRV